MPRHVSWEIDGGIESMYGQTEGHYAFLIGGV